MGRSRRCDGRAVCPDRTLERGPRRSDVVLSWDDAQLDGAWPEDTFVWDIEHGTRTLDDVLQSRGVDATGWELGHARALSGDGKVLLGRALCGDTPTLYRIGLSD